MKCKIALLLFLFFCNHLLSQKIDGLSDTYNGFVYLDSDSLLWISSLNALNRYDGTKVKVYWPNKFKENALSEGLIQSKFFEDYESNIWFTTVNYLNRYNRGSDSFTRFSISDSLSLYRIIGFDEVNLLYIQIGEGIYKFNIESESFDLIYQGLQGIDHSIKFDKNNDIEIIVATRWNYGNGILFLRKMDSNHFVCDTLLKEHVTWNIEKIGVDFLISSNNGLFALNDIGHIEKITNSKAISLEPNYAGKILANLGNSILIFESTTSIDSLIPKEKYSNIFQPSKNLMLGSLENEGLSLIDNKGTSKWNYIATNSSAYKFGFYGNDLFLSQENGDVLNLDNKSLKLIANLGSEPIFLQGSSYPFEVISETKRIKILKDKSVENLDKLNLVRIKGATKHWNEDLIVYSSEGISLLENDRIKKNPGNYSEFDITFMGSNGKIYNHAKEGLVIHKYSVDSLKLISQLNVNFSIHQFFEMSDSMILIATNDGIKYLDISTFQISTFVLEGMYIQSLVIDKNDRIWAATRNGFYRIDEDQNLTFYGEKNGLMPQTFVHDCATSSPDGTLYFGTNKGILYFHPDSIKDINYNPPMMLSSLKVHGHEWAEDTINIEVTPKVELDYNQNTLTFDFVAIDYDQNNHPQYSVYLEGYDVDTTSLGDQSKITYPNLQPGKYKFHYSACTLSGYCRDEFETFDVTIHPPYWETWWFRSLAALAGLSIVGFGIGLYLRNRLREQRFAFEKQELILKTELQLQQERNRIADELHDELGGKLSSIKFAGKKVQKATHLDEVKKITQRVSEISTELIESMRSIIWAMDTQNDTLSSLQANIRSYASTIGKDNDLKMHFDFQNNEADIIVKGQIRHHLFLTIKEILNNIIKHSSANEVVLNMSATENTLTSVISENGEGFTLPEISNLGKGIKSIDKRMKSINSTITYNNGDQMTISITTPLS